MGQLSVPDQINNWLWSALKHILFTIKYSKFKVEIYSGKYE
jgi:hypothetical protein